MTTMVKGFKADPSRDLDAEKRFEGLMWNVDLHTSVRARFGLRKDEQSLRRLASAYRVPDWVATGSIGIVEAMFLYDLIQGIRPHRIIEVGVASGCSTAALILGAADAGVAIVDDRGMPAVHGYDVLPHCYFDRNTPIGSAVRDMAPELVRGVQFHPGEDAAAAAKQFAREPVAFAFIDADHSHPMPTADLLMLMPALAPGAWVGLHDIDLPGLTRDYEREVGHKVDWAKLHGPKFLFDHWPFESIRGTGGARNIGAIRMPEDRSITAEDLGEIIDLPWEMKPGESALRALGRA